MKSPLIRRLFQQTFERVLLASEATNNDLGDWKGPIYTCRSWKTKVKYEIIFGPIYILFSMCDFNFKRSKGTEQEFSREQSISFELFFHHYYEEWKARWKNQWRLSDSSDEK